MQNSFDVYKFNRLTPLLKEISNHPLKDGRKKLSLRNWATRLGYKSPRSVGMVFVGQRLPSTLMINRLGSILKLNFEEKEYLQSLLTLEKLKNQSTDVESLTKEVNFKNPYIQNEKCLTPTEFSYIADWQHIVIKQLLNNKNLRHNLKNFKKILKNKLTEEQIQSALNHLEKLGLIQFSSENHSYQITEASFTTTNDIPSKAIQKHHFEMLKRALEALNEESVENREFTSATMCFNRKNMNDVKRLIREFRDRLEKMYEDKNSPDVFQLNIQFFSHTANDKAYAE